MSCSFLHAALVVLSLFGVGSRLVGVGQVRAAEVASGEQTLAELDAAWQAAIEPLERRAHVIGAERLAREMADWSVRASQPDDGRQLLVRIPSATVRPDWLPAGDPQQQAIWQDFLSARRRWAEQVFVAARTAADQEQGCEAFRLLAVVLVADPDHEQAREAGGWVKRSEEGVTSWLWPAAAGRASRREVFSAEFGWIPKTWLARYSAGERRLGSRWLPQADLPAPKKVADAPVWQSDHWRLTYLATESQAAALAAELETAHDVWWQAFGASSLERGDLKRMFHGQARSRPADSMDAVHFANRQEYVDMLEPLEPQVGRTQGMYWAPTQVAYFFQSEDFEATTMVHEATHQLFAESRRTSRLAGERNNFWVIEAVACYMESLEAHSAGWKLGGLDYGRVPAAVERLTEDDFYVPLASLCALGRVEFQAHPDLPAVYSQISGLADFFMNGQQGRYREAFVEYLKRTYDGAAAPETLSRLCGVDFAELDDQYRRHLSR